VKAVRFHPLALEVIRTYSEATRRDLGKALHDLQMGATIGMPLSRPMPVVSDGAAELRLRDKDGIYRVFYVLRHAGAILVFHAFTKKTQATPPRELDLARKRLKEMEK